MIRRALDAGVEFLDENGSSREIYRHPRPVRHHRRPDRVSILKGSLMEIRPIRTDQDHRAALARSTRAGALLRAARRATSSMCLLHWSRATRQSGGLLRAN